VNDDRRVFLGWVDEAKAKPSPLLVRHGDDWAATWPYGPGGAPHMAVVGTTGGGKSSLLRMLALGLVRLPGERGIIIIDGEGAGEFTMFRRARNVAAIVNSNEAADTGSVALADQALADVLAEVIGRNADLTRAQQQAEATRRTPDYVPPADLFVVVDGWMSLVYDIGKVLAGSAREQTRMRERAVGRALQIARIGRKVGVHLVLAMHRPDARSVETGLPGELKSLLGARVAAVGPLGLRKVEAEMCFDDATAGARVPRDEHGNGVLGGCLLQIGATEVPFKVPPQANPTSADPAVTDEQRAAVWRRLPSAAAA